MLSERRARRRSDREHKGVVVGAAFVVVVVMVMVALAAALASALAAEIAPLEAAAAAPVVVVAAAAATFVHVAKNAMAWAASQSLWAARRCCLSCGRDARKPVHTSSTFWVYLAFINCTVV